MSKPPTRGLLQAFSAPAQPRSVGPVASAENNLTAVQFDCDGDPSRQPGWTFGAGLEYAFLGNLTAKVEFLYVDLGKFNCVACSGALTDDVTFKESIIRGGLNYRFSGPIFSRY